jgi:protein O-mannosyl-transferase
VFCAFWPSVSNGFVNLDDPMYVCENAHVLAGLTWQGIGWAFTNVDAGFWHPLTWLSLMLDCQMFGLRAGGHHLVSLLLHATTTILLFLALRRMTGATWRSATIAILFALHPLHVESVAWVSDRKDVLSAFFCFLSLLFYARYAEQSKLQHPRYKLSYSLALLFFLCGLMSKATILTLPVVMLFLDWWPLCRCEPFAPVNPAPALPPDKPSVVAFVSTLKPLLWEKLPFFAAAALSCLVSVYGQGRLGALPDATQFPLKGRIANAILSNGYYLAQTLWPANLAAYYPYPRSFPLWPVVGAALLGLAVSVVVLWTCRRYPFLAIGWLWYVITILPVIGLLQVGGHSRADHYTYVPLIGLFLLLVWGADALARRGRCQALAVSMVSLALLFLCLVLARNQLGYWKNSEALLRHAIVVTSDNPEAQNNLGLALTDQGRLDEAITHFEEALRLVPDSPDAHNNLATALGMQGRFDEAIHELQVTLRLRPDYGKAHYNLCVAFLHKRSLDEAIAHAHRALELRPDFAEAHSKLGSALLQQGLTEEAMVQFQQAVQLKPKLANAHSDLAGLLLQKRRVSEAISHYQSAIDLQPANPYFLNNLAWVLATCPEASVRNGAKALSLAQRAERLSEGKNPAIVGTLAAAYAEAGRFPEALATAQHALELATAQTNSVQADMLRANIALFRAGSPFYEAGPTNGSRDLKYP